MATNRDDYIPTPARQPEGQLLIYDGGLNLRSASMAVRLAAQAQLAELLQTSAKR